MNTLGICFGATTIQAVCLVSKNSENTVKDTWRISHEGNPREILLSFLASIDTNEIDRIAITGRNFKDRLNLTAISESEAVECATKATYRSTSPPEIVISFGGETQLVYKINPDFTIDKVLSGNKCASGTGEFFLQQIKRIGLTLEEALELAKQGKAIKIAGRCSVFCKSDCTHALNKGVNKADIVAGLIEMLADKVTEVIGPLDIQRAALIGGGSFNTELLKTLNQRIKNVETPEYAAVFEAYGAALWATENPCLELAGDFTGLFKEAKPKFTINPPLNKAADLVVFKTDQATPIAENGEYILGLDVGSTTTKAVLLARSDKSVAASIYLRTEGNPIEASRNCFKALEQQIGEKNITITGLGVTGSGRQIAALYALSDDVINEIVTHATAAAAFDPKVDTIIEIGGQDAKYTFLTNGIPTDYAMNEACSAGTGSFLEEAAFESLSVKTEDIESHALKSEQPPNFSDQCSAFISSDIKTASQDGAEKEDLLAGLVYSICHNYLNRVMGAKPVGKKIFMQGGVCYNKAVPLAMATILKTEIIVPPHPGLMGAYGVALETDRNLAEGVSKPGDFNLQQLIDRKAEKTNSFICKGGKEKCDIKCTIDMFSVDGEKYPFGGSCNRYYNRNKENTLDTSSLDLVRLREHLVFDVFGTRIKEEDTNTNQVRDKKVVGIPRSFLTHSLFPLYSTFFAELGFDIILSEQIDEEGLKSINSAYCFPAEQAHGCFIDLLKRKPDYIFLPHVMQIPVANVPTFSRACVFVQGETYYLKSLFRNRIKDSKIPILSPILKMPETYLNGKSAFIEMANDLKVTAKQADRAFDSAMAKQLSFEKRLRDEGKKALEMLDKNPVKTGIVLFGRPYNAFTSQANMGIPRKVASRGYVIIPHDMLSVDEFEVDKQMYWAMGQKILKAAQYVAKKQNLFAFYITNFSCGPDSFIIKYFERHMSGKPFLTLELDQHTTDIGIDTRIEAALDIISRHRFIEDKKQPKQVSELPFPTAKIEGDKIISSSGKAYDFTDPHVEIIIPSMGSISSRFMTALFQSYGVKSTTMPVPDENILQIGRNNTTCKECLPYQLTTGTLIDYVKKRKDPDMVTFMFMPTGGGPCRLGQYATAQQQLLAEERIPNAGMFSLTNENGYAGMGNKALLKVWKGVVASDILNEIRNYLSVSAEDKSSALAELDSVVDMCIQNFAGEDQRSFWDTIKKASRRISNIKTTKSLQDIPVISLVGEMYVRLEEFSRRDIVDTLENEGFMVRIAPVGEFLHYSNYVINKGLGETKFTFLEHQVMKVIARLQEFLEWRIKRIFAKSGKYHFEMTQVAKTITGISHLLNHNFRNESLLTVGLGMREILAPSCGVISIGPFGCMPSRVAESVLKNEMTREGISRMKGWKRKTRKLNGMETLPFLAIETDGLEFPQLTQANLEAFMLKAKRLHRTMSRQN